MLGSVVLADGIRFRDHSSPNKQTNNLDRAGRRTAFAANALARAPTQIHASNVLRLREKSPETLGFPPSLCSFLKRVRRGGERSTKADFTRSFNWKAPVSKHDRVTASICPAMVPSNTCEKNKNFHSFCPFFERRGTERRFHRRTHSTVCSFHRRAMGEDMSPARFHGGATSTTDRSFLIVIVMRLRTVLLFQSRAGACHNGA